MNSRIALYDSLRYLGKKIDLVKDTHGNVSCKEGDSIWIKPSGMEYSEISHTDICEFDINRPRPEHNKRKPSVDLPHHITIYKKHPWIKAICHTHSPYVVAHAICWQNIVCYTTEQADYFGTDVYCRSYSDLNNWGKDLCIFVDEKAVLLGNHGALTFAENPMQAVKLAIALENIAMKNVLASSITHPRELLQDEIDKWHERYNESYGQ